MTKEEVLRNVMDERKDSFSLWEDEGHDFFDVKCSTVFKAMEEYAKQQCEELRERLSKANNLLKYAGRINNHDMGFEVDLLDYFELPKI